MCENNSFNGLLVCNIELTNVCNKSCFCCGRRKLEKDYSKKADFTQHMPLDLVYRILDQLPTGIVVQFHNNGEPTCYPYLKKALTYRTDIIRSFNTNGKLLLEKANDIINNLDTLTISVIENDSEGDEQYNVVKKFLDIKGDKKPYVIFRLLGDVGKREIHIGFESDKSELELMLEYKNRIDRWYNLAKEYHCLIATRILHSPEGSFNYQKKVTIPEIGICLDLLSHIVVDVEGDIFPCIRFNPNKINNLGNIMKTTLNEAWNSDYRQYLIKEHSKGNRKCNELCKTCDFYGCPTSI